MKIVAVDLAAKFSAACHMNERGVVLNELDSWGRTENNFIDAVTSPWRFSHPPTALVIEDLPHGVPFMVNTKSVCRMQGRFIDRMHSYGYAEDVYFIAPAAWRKHYALKNGSGPEAVVAMAAELGYQPPDLSNRVSKAGEKATARKVGTDYCAANLIARWFLDGYHALGGFTFPGVSRHGDPTPPRTRRPSKKAKETKTRGKG